MRFPDCAATVKVRYMNSYSPRGEKFSRAGGVSHSYDLNCISPSQRGAFFINFKLRGHMKISKGVWVVIITLIIAGGAFWLVSANNSSDTNDAEQNQTEQAAPANEIVFNADGTVAAYDGVPGEIALTTLKSLTDVSVQESAYGEFVTGINGVEADSSTNFWGFYVNGEMATVGAGEYVAEEGDQIEWQLTELEN